ncbi:MAG: L(+)-tartrate dehydratase subunit alpha [Actinobacteria bacterium ADurb.Bin444]|nr:MAG: L(+)-tartrate dehydratase subunit alpha [Actinobacteria bacterium ADurb.Bin444]
MCDLMRELHAQVITAAVDRLFREACTRMADDVRAALERALDQEQGELGREVLLQLLKNAEVAAAERLPLCQDTGLAVMFVELGQDVHVVGGSLEAALNEGVRSAYVGAMLRCSCVAEPAHARINTGDNTPAIVHMRVVPGDRLRIVALPKGAGAENKSTLTMLEPSRGIRGVIDSVVDTVQRGGASACPPLVVGVGVGGNFEKAALLAKLALLRPLGSTSLVPRLASLESELKTRCNALGIGPMGLGGTVTVLDVFVEEAPCHIASLPVAVNLQCHAQRHREVLL